ncbi:MAG: hypothetical protein RLZZ578_1453, partial [Bacteroidota bacterium]
MKALVMFAGLLILGMIGCTTVDHRSNLHSVK